MQAFSYQFADYRCMVVGNPIAHSKSPTLHQAFANQAGLTLSYHRQLCPNDEASFTALIGAFFYGGGTGANITVPFKEMAYNLCQQTGTLSADANLAGAVNTLALVDGKLYGDNTDGRGLVNHMLQMGWPLKDQTVLILGAGGAAHGILMPLIQAGVSAIHIANRSVDKACALVSQLQQQAEANAVSLSYSSLDAIPITYSTIVINATSIGLNSNTLPFSPALNADYAYDMMYGKPSAFLDFFHAKGATTSDGLGMLIHQGALSFELWTGKPVDLVALGNPFC